MKKITGLGGVFIKAKDPKILAAWYEENLGIGFNKSSYIDLPFTDEVGKLHPGIMCYRSLNPIATILIPAKNR